jgi:hypothetical protein
LRVPPDFFIVRPRPVPFLSEDLDAQLHLFDRHHRRAPAHAERHGRTHWMMSR